MTLGEQIKKARVEKGFSQSDLAEKLFVTKQSISKYENNKSIPSNDILENLREILDISLEKDDRIKKISFTRKTWILYGVAIVLIFGLLISTTTLYIKNRELETLLNQEIVEIQGYEMSYMSNQVNFSGDYLYIQLSVYNTNDGGKTLHGDFFTIDGVVTGAHFVNGPNWQQLYTYATYFQPFETQVIWLEVSVDDTDNYFENHNHVDLFCNGIFIQRIEIEN